MSQLLQDLAPTRQSLPPDPEVGELECPECFEQDGERRPFGSKQGLALHRSRAHGVKKPGAKRKRAKPGSRPQRSKRTIAKTLDTRPLLRAVFPSGVPADPAAVVRAAEWLSEAERLYQVGVAATR